LDLLNLLEHTCDAFTSLKWDSDPSEFVFHLEGITGQEDIAVH